MSKTAYVVRHIHFENAGILEPLLIERGFTLEYIEAPLADFNQYDATKADLVIVCGAPIGAYDEEIYPFLNDEIKFIKDRIDSKKPLLGICLGAQLISRIMGGHVGPMSHGKKEIGFGPLRFTAEGQHTPLALLGNTPVLHWHGDEFDIPEGAVRLAETDLCPNQAFAIGNHILGLQFHLEADIRPLLKAGLWATVQSYVMRALIFLESAKMHEYSPSPYQQQAKKLWPHG